VVLKILNNSREPSAEFLQEIAYHKSLNDYNGIAPELYGISQDPETKNYIMVMKYMKEGSLRQYLNNKNNDRLLTSYSFKNLCDVAKGLKDVHEKGLIHRDFHSGNILKGTLWHITDLGLCRPANETDKGKVYGVLPYVAPEVLCGKPYSQTSDIYSFGIIA